MSQENSHPAILLVEDTPSQATTLISYLESNGCSVHWADTGLDGVNAAQEKRFDLIVLDVELPDIDGFEVCRRLKENMAIADIPVVMLTTRDRATDARRGLENGAIDYIPKDPFAKMVLLETLKQMGLFGDSGE